MSSKIPCDGIIIPDVAQIVDKNGTVLVTAALQTAIGRILHSSSPGATLPTTSNFIGELFVKNGATKKGTYSSLDLVGNWTGPLE